MWGTLRKLVMHRPLFGRWWRRQSPARQDRFATLGPLISVLLFLVVILLAFWTLRAEEIERETDSVRRDTEITRQLIGQRLVDHQQQLERLARDLVTRPSQSREFSQQAEAFLRERPELERLAWLDARRQIRMAEYGMVSQPPDWPAGTSEVSDPSLPREGLTTPAELAFRAARDSRRSAYSRAFNDLRGQPVFQLYTPILDRGTVLGMLVLDYSIDGVLRQAVPLDVSRRHLMSIVDDKRIALATTLAPEQAPASRRNSLVHDTSLHPQIDGLILRGEGWRTSFGLISNTLSWMVVALSLLTLWMLIGAWRHMRRRAQMQGALLQETQFRRAMENSMLTGMRALDLDGRITYVNAAFCQMSGFSESELVGRLPPYPYWPPDRVEENQRLLQQEMQGRNPVGGIEVQLMRKDGTLFDARMYVSPLIDPKGQQTGWMTSMTNITEAKRIRDQLAASHERFTTVLEGLEASVSVLSVHQNELLFANRSYRLWFGSDAQGHAQLTGGAPARWPGGDIDGELDELSGLPTHALTEARGDLRDAYIEELDKWFEVRSRYLQWTDGRLAQMVIATDITSRRRAEEQAAHQAEKVAVTSRLMTMGEMASSVAHELNQPLTAITNYCNGMLSRVSSDAMAKEDLMAALAKTARQAERAGQIIHRIRAFVKKSEPQRQVANPRQIVDDAVELAGIELRRRNVAIRTYLAQRLPLILVDPILIEQVLLNLLKNAAEAIDAAQMPAARRHIELRVTPQTQSEEGSVIEFSVMDTGPGLPDAVIERLYEAFFSTKAEGLGIGLSLCRSIVESHRGRMRAQNLYNGPSIVGCLFSFTLPVDDPEQVDDALNARATSENSQPTTTSLTLP